MIIHRHREAPTGPAFGRPEDRLRAVAIQGRRTNAGAVALDCHAAWRRLAMTVEV